ncbi:MAG TPA: hypothetical protein VLZ56_06490 [Mycoplana sp.]|nr:hypothetical protein [Mycoplana sp.]
MQLHVALVLTPLAWGDATQGTERPEAALAEFLRKFPRKKKRAASDGYFDGCLDARYRGAAENLSERELF